MSFLKLTHSLLRENLSTINQLLFLINNTSAYRNLRNQTLILIGIIPSRTCRLLSIIIFYQRGRQLEDVNWKLNKSFAIWLQSSKSPLVAIFQQSWTNQKYEFVAYCEYWKSLHRIPRTSALSLLQRCVDRFFRLAAPRIISWNRIFMSHRWVELNNP